MKTRRTSLQYNPHALQFNSSLRPRLQSGVCVAPQLTHSAFTPPGAELLTVAAFPVVTVAEGPFEVRELEAEPEAVFTVKFGFDELRVLMPELLTCIGCTVVGIASREERDR